MPGGQLSDLYLKPCKTNWLNRSSAYRAGQNWNSLLLLIRDQNQDQKSYCRAASVRERSEANDRCLFEPRRYIFNICIARHVTAHVTPSREGSSFQRVLLLLFGRSSLPACSRGSGAQKEREGTDGNGNNAAVSSMPKGPCCKTVRAT